MWDWKSGVLVRVAGESGEGVISCGDLITRAFGRTGMDIFTFRTFPAEIKGGPAMNQVRAVDGVALSQGDSVDCLVAFNAEGCHLHGPEVRPGGMLIYDPSDWEDLPDPTVIRVPVALAAIASELKSKLSKNIVALGATGRALGLPQELLETVVREKFRKKPEQVVEKNIAALIEGYQRVELPGEMRPQALSEVPVNPRRVVMSGNQALVLGALAAGVDYYAGYPITPASDIMEGLMAQLPKLGGTVLQTEDEISALASCIGASYTGARAMTASSGPGISLMVELIGYATMAEIPVVIVDAQRGGPSTGLPTKVEQSDLELAVYGGHGEAPRIVISPGSVSGCFKTMAQAFNLAEKYQCPVIVLTDAALATRTQQFDRPDALAAQTVDRLTPTEEELQDYKRYRDSASGVSPMAIPGTPGGQYISTGLEHGENALPNYTGDNHTKMLAKRWRKIQPAASEEDAVVRFGPETSHVGIISWGSSEGAIREACARLSGRGMECAHLQARILSPLPEEQIGEFLTQVDTVIVAELNYSGQFAKMLRSAFVRPFVQLNKATGLPFTAGDIIKAVMEVWPGGSDNHNEDNSRLQVRRKAGLVPGLW